MFNYGHNTIKHGIGFTFIHCMKPKERIKLIIIIIIIINQLIMMWYDFGAVLDLLDRHSDL